MQYGRPENATLFFSRINPQYFRGPVSKSVERNQHPMARQEIYQEGPQLGSRTEYI
jgi:hypothetical protein